MGYYTEFELISVTGADKDDVIAACNELFGYECFGDRWKWYTHEDDMKRVSLQFPGAVIVTSGVGEEYPDIWKAWFKDGKMKKTRARIEFDEPETYDNISPRRY